MGRQLTYLASVAPPKVLLPLRVRGQAVEPGFSAWRLPATAGVLPANRSQAGGVGGAGGADNDGKERALKERVLERRK